MNKVSYYIRTAAFRTGLLVALAFGLTSAAYLAWLDRLVLLAGGAASDWLSLVAGYLLQAVGLLLASLFFKEDGFSRDNGREMYAVRLRHAFALTLVLFAAVTVPALLTDSPPAVIIFGFLMNLLCGVIAGFYLRAICTGVDVQKRSTVFGGGYALATAGVGLLAITHLTRGWSTVPVCLILTGALVWANTRFAWFRTAEDRRPYLVVNRETAGEAPASAPHAGKEPQLLPLACAAIVLISVVKNLGFNFPSADIQSGLVPEIARIPYALGLTVAGLINDRSRKNGLICTVAALIIPFIMLGLGNEPISNVVFWGLNYVFYAFFSVFRVVIILDLAAAEGSGSAPRWYLAPLGLLFGRLGDVIGSGIGLALASRQVVLIAVSALLFIPTVFVLYRLYEGCFMPEAVQQRNEKELFDTFCMHNDLSAREREVLHMLLAGQTNAQIAEALFISENTVKFHVKNILQKTGCKNRGDLRTKYMQTVYRTEATVVPFP